MRRFLYWLTFGLLAALLLVRPVFSQTVIPVTGHLGDPSQGTPAGMSVKFELYNCGANTPKVVGTFSIIKQNFTLTPDSTGLLTGNIVPNDIISCGGTVGTTYYNVTTLLNGVPQAPAACYSVQRSVGTFNLDVATPCTSISPPTPPSPPVDGTYNNLLVNGVLSGGSALFGSTVQATEFILASTPNPCGSGQFMTGYTATFAVECATPSFASEADVAAAEAAAIASANATSANASNLTNGMVNASLIPTLPYLPTSTQLPISKSQIASQWLVSFNAATGQFISTQPSFGDISGTIASGQLPTGLVTAVSVATANGVSGSSSGGSTPELTITLGAINPTSVAPTGTGFPIESGVSGNTDLTGEITLSAGTGSYAFVSVPALTNRPECFIHDHTTPANDHTNTFVVTASGITVTSTGTSDLIGYICIGRI